MIKLIFIGNRYKIKKILHGVVMAGGAGKKGSKESEGEKFYTFSELELLRAQGAISPGGEEAGAVIYNDSERFGPAEAASAGSMAPVPASAPMAASVSASVFSTAVASAPAPVPTQAPLSFSGVMSMPKKDAGEVSPATPTGEG